MDAVKNFVKVNVSTGYDDVATSVVLSASEGAKLPDPAIANFNLVWFNATDYADPADDPNVEIVRVTGRSTDTLTVVRPAVGNSYNGETSANTAKTHNAGGKAYKMILAPTYKIFNDLNTDVSGRIANTIVDAKGDIIVASADNTPARLAVGSNGQQLVADSAEATGLKWVGQPQPANLLKNGNFINNSTNGYGGIPDDWTNANVNPVQGGFPTLTKQQLIDLLGINDGDIEGLWNLTETSGNAADLSSNNYALTDTNTVLYSVDGLMGNARDFERDNSEYLTIADASCPNLEISGSQTWFAFAKPESLADYLCIMAKTSAVNTADKRIIITSTGVVQALFAGLTTNNSINSDVKVETGKIYLIVARYDSVAQTLSIFVNGVKKSLSASGSMTDSNGNFSIGRLGGVDNFYFDGLIQCAGVLSVALTDDQIKALFAATLYKGTKIRASSQYATLSQTVNAEVVERLRGKTVTIRASVYQSQASDVSLYTNENGSTVTVLTPPTTYNQWVDVSLTVTLSSTLRTLEIGIQSRNANLLPIWVKNVALYESSVTLPYQHSPDDWARFPRLLKMDIPNMIDAFPYQYEENRIYSNPSPKVTGFSSLTTNYYYWKYCGKVVDLVYFITGTSNATSFSFLAPVECTNRTNTSSRVTDNGTTQGAAGMAFIDNTSNSIALYKTFLAGTWTGSGAKGAEGNISYFIQ